MKAGVLLSGVSRDPAIALRQIRADGFAYAEIQYAWGAEDGDRTPDQETQLKRLFAENRVTCTAIMRNLFSGLRLSDTAPDGLAFLDELALLRDAIRLARHHGCALVRINSFDKQNVLFGFGGAENHLADGGAWRRYLRLMEPVCQIAEDEGIDLMVETGTNGVLHTAALARRAADELRSRRFRVLWDPANCLYSGEDPLHGYDRIREVAAEIHIKDLRCRRALAEVTYCTLGRGLMAPFLDELADTLRRDRFDGAVILENQVTPPGKTELDGYRGSAGLFREIFGDTEGGKTHDRSGRQSGGSELQNGLGR